VLKSLAKAQGLEISKTKTSKLQELNSASKHKLHKTTQKKLPSQGPLSTLKQMQKTLSGVNIIKPPAKLSETLTSPSKYSEAIKDKRLGNKNLST